MKIGDTLSIGDIEMLAKRRLPRVVYEGIASGVEDERGVARNEAEFHQYRLLPRAMVDVSERDQIDVAVWPRLCQSVRHFADRYRRDISPRRRTDARTSGKRGAACLS